jgi:hypothetical protein
MKRILSVSLTLVLSAVLLVLVPISKHSAFTAHAGSGCTNANLSGDYGLTFSGFQLQSGRSVPFYGAGLGTSDGAGSFAASFASSQNGALPGNRYAVNVNNQYTATYSVNSNCTGLLTATPGSGGDNFAFVIVKGGAEVLATDLSAPDTLNLNLKKQ